MSVLRGSEEQKPVEEGAGRGLSKLDVGVISGVGGVLCDLGDVMS